MFWFIANAALYLCCISICCCLYVPVYLCICASASVSESAPASVSGSVCVSVTFNVWCLAFSIYILHGSRNKICGHWPTRLSPPAAASAACWLHWPPVARSRFQLLLQKQFIVTRGNCQGLHYVYFVQNGHVKANNTGGQESNALASRQFS